MDSAGHGTPSQSGWLELWLRSLLPPASRALTGLVLRPPASGGPPSSPWMDLALLDELPLPSEGAPGLSGRS